MAVYNFAELASHVGHDIVCVGYSWLPGPAEWSNVAIECETCGCVLMDYNNPQQEGKDDQA